MVLHHIRINAVFVFDMKKRARLSSYIDELLKQQDAIMQYNTMEICGQSMRINFLFSLEISGNNLQEHLLTHSNT